MLIRFFFALIFWAFSSVLFSIGLVCLMTKLNINVEFVLRHFYKFRVTFSYCYSSLTVDDESLNLLAFLSFFVAKGGGGGLS